jgi:hypothetical protein
MSPQVYDDIRRALEYQEAALDREVGFGPVQRAAHVMANQRLERVRRLIKTLDRFEVG